jgi:hypothetical protein
MIGGSSEVSKRRVGYRWPSLRGHSSNLPTFTPSALASARNRDRCGSCRPVSSRATYSRVILARRANSACVQPRTSPDAGDQAGAVPAKASLVHARGHRVYCHGYCHAPGHLPLVCGPRRVACLTLGPHGMWRFHEGNDGGRSRDRTCDFSLVRAALSQLSYPPGP